MRRRQPTRWCLRSREKHFPAKQIGFACWSVENKPPLRTRNGARMTGAKRGDWLPLTKATVLIDHDVQKARERLERAISKAWQTRGVPQPALDPNVPLRIQVTPPPGWQIVGRAWSENPILDWDSSEIECPCKPWTPPRPHLQSSAAPSQRRAKIEVWGEDLVRLWGGKTPSQLRQDETRETASALPLPSQTDGSSLGIGPSVQVQINSQPSQGNTPAALYNGCAFDLEGMTWKPRAPQ
jgi:hypothetical protein